MSCPKPCAKECQKDFCVVDEKCEDITSKVSKLTKFDMKLQVPLNKISETKTKSLLKTFTSQCGKTYNKKDDYKGIKKFINDYKIKWEDAKECKDSDLDNCVKKFNTINDFFTRELKEGIRPIGIKDQACINNNNNIICQNEVVSPADSQVVVYDSLGEAKKIWIKGESFTIKGLLNIADKNYDSDKLAIFYLTPSDYHRFHSPINGNITQIDFIKGAYYSVNSTVIHKNLDVYGQNNRVILYLTNVPLGTIPMVIIGSTCVGSIVLTFMNVYNNLKEKYDNFKTNENLYTLSLKRLKIPITYGQELGYFQFGGSTIILLFEQGGFNFCPSLLTTSNNNTARVMKYGEFVGSFNPPNEDS